MSVIAEADDGSAALKLIREYHPDVVVLDINMPGLSGFEVVSSMRDEQLSGEVILLTMHNQERMFAQAVNLGVRGYVLKDSATNDILNCLQAVRKGQHYTSAELTQYLFKKASGETRAVKDWRRSRQLNVAYWR